MLKIYISTWKQWNDSYHCYFSSLDACPITQPSIMLYSQEYSTTSPRSMKLNTVYCHTVSAWILRERKFNMIILVGQRKGEKGWNLKCLSPESTLLKVTSCFWTDLIAAQPASQPTTASTSRAEINVSTHSSPMHNNINKILFI